jgi:ABC-type transport system involved in cytochrome bd biosynthesis fused ATPase/permease subunit
MRAIMDRYKDSTILLITHRKSLLGYMKRALVIEGGKLARDAQISKVPKP